ncbi:MAG: hypothetical protein HPM95_11305 [Alphaproteobacteria bacterium]|nr:hypothetical protein [Alphaproteobacteria bacterium]
MATSPTTIARTRAIPQAAPKHSGKHRTIRKGDPLPAPARIKRLSALALALLAGACSSSASIGSAVLTSDGRGAATIDTQTLTIGTQRPTDVPPPPGG